MNIQFREVDTFNLWIWVEFPQPPTQEEQQYLEEIFSSWFLLGKLGGFNAENLPVQDQGYDLNFFPYDTETSDDAFLAVMHNMGEVEYQDHWARCWFDLGTSDGLALDILLNVLRQFDQEYVPLKTVIIGGVNPDWPVDHFEPESPLADDF
ncbi:hypothetical protein GlitD10_0268 [Gloeomargarita lithophora Alchichica-D10]|uniref:DUF3531 domain-containing protein n=1 Tax=Gloeomargarita lithophora Alchichica-D10 TaxID=1188229 RepID=A0A1J0A9J4_9CYAN|nr:DUF3531 family protein [Gloeomargarita lithophora]APB32569.1 hypothetical protein GlitD10_0268 [Gloeomargarita lithophora Alchichica-D10]